MGKNVSFGNNGKKIILCTQQEIFFCGIKITQTDDKLNQHYEDYAPLISIVKQRFLTTIWGSYTRKNFKNSRYCVGQQEIESARDRERHKYITWLRSFIF